MDKILIKVGSGAVDDVPEERPVVVSLDARKALDGNIMIFDHIDIDIVIMPDKKKVVAFVKEEFGDEIYEAQNRLFKFLAKKGVIKPESVRAGNVYGALEGVYPDSFNDKDPNKVVLFMIAKFIEEEKPYFAWDKAMEDAEEKRLTDPDEDESTELGEVPQKSRKGSVNAYTSMGRYMNGF